MMFDEKKLHMSRRMALALPLFAMVGTRPVLAQLAGSQDTGKIDPLPIAVTPFISGGNADVAATISGVVANNLARCGYFAPLPPDSFIDQVTDFNAEPLFSNWRQVQAKALVTGLVQGSGSKLQVSYKLFDVASQQMLAGEVVSGNAKNARRMAHRISDAIYRALTGYEGYFDTRIVFIHEEGGKEARVKKLAIMDQDGFNARTLPVSGDLLLTPRFSPNSNEITYMSFGTGTPRVYIYNIDTNQREIVGDFPNMSFAPRFTPDGQGVIMSLQSDDGRDSNIYEMDLRSKRLRQLTNAPAINTSPSYAPDGSRIAFESDRGGTQQIYMMGSDGSGQDRISFGKGRYSTPVWSPDGKWIAFTKQGGGKFAIGVMKPDGSGERILTEGYHNEAPTWSPNSRVIMFFRERGGEQGGPQLYSVDVTGYNEQAVTTPGFASDPAWSPRLA
jgi:TolB protein